MKNILDYFFKKLDESIQKKNLEILKKNIGPKINTYIDIGAHQGEMINILRKNFGVKKIYAFEPNKDCHLYLKKKRISKLFLYALSDKNGVGRFKLGHLSSMSTLTSINNKAIYSKIKKLIIKIFYNQNNIYKKTINVDKKRFDCITELKKLKKIDLVKIDTEGHEFNVIKGFGRYLKKIHLLLFEHHYDNSLIKNYNYSNVNKYLFKNNFKLISKNKMKFRKGYELIYKNIDNV